MNAENSEARLKKMEDKVDQMGEIARECIETCDRILKVAKGEGP